MRFEWDEAKRRVNLRAHAIHFAGCDALFDGCTLTAEDTRADYGESCFVTIGLLQGRVVTVVHTETADTIRVIAIRRATRREAKIYFETFAN